MEENKTQKIEMQTVESTQDESLDLNAPISVHLHKLTAQDYKEQFIEDYNHCCLCGKELDFTHVAHFIDNLVKEEAFCPCCNVRTRSLVHTLQ